MFPGPCHITHRTVDRREAFSVIKTVPLICACGPLDKSEGFVKDKRSLAMRKPCAPLLAQSATENADALLPANGKQRMLTFSGRTFNAVQPDANALLILVNTIGIR